MDKFKGLNAITANQKKIFNSIPNRRKKAGIKAHINVYKKIKAYSNFTHLSKFLGLPHPGPQNVEFKIFFEVSLGNRIADCVIVAMSGETRICYIVELKTCMSNTASFESPIRQVQRLQGLAQLTDTVNFLKNNSPSGSGKYSLIPVLVFKTQNTFKTVAHEVPTLKANIFFATDSKLISFLSQRQDVSISAILNTPASKRTPKRGRRKPACLGPKQKKLSTVKQAGNRLHAKTKLKTPISNQVFKAISDKAKAFEDRTQQCLRHPHYPSN